MLTGSVTDTETMILSIDSRRLCFKIFALVAFAAPCWAQEGSVITVKKNITLADTEKPLKDFYLNIGLSNGLKKGSVLKVERKVLVRDSTGAQSYGEIRVPVGELQIISAYPKVSVARELKIYGREDLPLLEQIGIMVGDMVLKLK